jgi:hypothetical protein
MLNENATEDDRIGCSIRVPAANVNDILQGQAMQVKFSHLPGYEDWTCVRVLRRTVSQPHGTDFEYDIAYELSPTVQSAAGTDVNLTLGTDSRDASRHTGDGAKVWTDPTNANDGDDTTSAAITNGAFAFADYIMADLGSAQTISGFNIYASNGPSNLTDFQYSTDGSTWHSISGTETGIRNDFPIGATFTFSASITARYWAIEASATSAHPTIRLNRWAVLSGSSSPCG